VNADHCNNCNSILRDGVVAVFVALNGDHA
jgi:hypothetical protein